MHGLLKKVNVEEEGIDAFVVNPCFCQTDMGNTAAKFGGLEKAFLLVSETCPQIVQLIDTATKKSHGSRLLNYDGK